MKRDEAVHRAEKLLENLIHECRGEGPASSCCPILDALDPDNKESAT